MSYKLDYQIVNPHIYILNKFGNSGQLPLGCSGDRIYFDLGTRAAELELEMLDIYITMTIVPHVWRFPIIFQRERGWS